MPDLPSWNDLFSVARDEAGDESDVDCFFDLARPQGFTHFTLAAVRERLQDIAGTTVDLMTRSGLHPRRRQFIEAQAIQVF